MAMPSLTKLVLQTIYEHTECPYNTQIFNAILPQHLKKPDHIKYDPVEHEPPPEQADPGTPKHQEKIKFHPFINSKKFSQ